MATKAVAIKPLDYPVALASGIFQTSAIEDGHLAARIPDDTRLLQRAGSQGHARTSRSQHLREEFVCHRQQVRVGAILAHQHPPCQATLNFMQTVAGRQLRHLHSLNMGIAVEQQTQLRSRPQDIEQDFRSYPYAVSGDLNNGAIGTLIDVCCQGRAYATLAADNSHFDAAAIAGRDYQRHHASVEKPGVVDFFRGLVNVLVILQLDELQVRAKFIELAVRKCIQDLVVYGVSDGVGASASTRYPGRAIRTNFV